MSGQAVADNLARIRERIAAVCARTGRPEGSVRLVGVTKRVPLPLVVEACRAGLRDLGENRVQDALERIEAVGGLLAAAGIGAETIRWHFIGHLQRNKAARASGRFALLHGVDSEELAGVLSRLAVQNGRTQSLLLEVNVSGEVQKSGVDPEAAPAIAARIGRLPGLELGGLMGMARYGAAEPELRATFAGLRSLADRLRTATGLPLPELSMGMSGDFEAAIAEGSTLVRIGTAIFGERQE